MKSGQGENTAALARSAPEATYQDELYRCLMDQLEPGVSMCSEWTGSDKGSMDFYIPGAKWAIELLRDGNRSKEHRDRFRAGGLYYPWVQAGDIEDLLVLDFRNHKPRKPGNVVSSLVFGLVS